MIEKSSTRKINPTDSAAWLLFWLRVGLLGVFGVILTFVGLQSLKPAYYLLGIGLFLLSVATYFWRHPRRPSQRWFVVFAAIGFPFVIAGVAWP